MSHAAAVPPGGALHLTVSERAMLAGDHGPGVALAMRIVVAVARVRGAPRLVPIGSAHLDGCLYHGQASLDFVRRLAELGATTSVPTTLNVGSVDLLHPGLVRERTPAEQEAVAQGRALMATYVGLGARPTFTCAPYQHDPRPGFGEHVAWAESNAIAFANSVLGARTDRYGDFVDVCAAITGRAPYAGLHTDAARRGEVLIDCTGIAAAALREELAAPLLGYLTGATVGTAVPVLVGLPDWTEDQLKAFGAAAASSGGVALFHIVGRTPEAATAAEAFGGREPIRRVTFSEADLHRARVELCTVTRGPLDAVSIGTPHASAAEIAALADLLVDGPPFAPGMQVYLSTSRRVAKEVEAEAPGRLSLLQEAGVRLVLDTCTYVTPILGEHVRAVMTNSGKWAHYAPGNLGVQVVLGSLAECVDSARAGDVRLAPAGASASAGDAATSDPVASVAATGNAVNSEAATSDAGPEQDPVGGDRAAGPAGPVGEDALLAADDPGGRAAPAPSTIPATPLHPGSGQGPLLVLDEPLSFWGGTDADGVIIDRHHPQRGRCIAGTVLVMVSGRGSSSSSSVLAEQVRADTGPAAIVLAEADAIVALGAIVAAELYGIDVPVVQIDPAALRRLGHATGPARVEAATSPATIRLG